MGKLWLPDGQYKEGLFENNSFTSPIENGKESLPPSPLSRKQAKNTLIEDTPEKMGFES